MGRTGRLQIEEIIQLNDKSIHELFTESFEEITEILEIIKNKKTSQKVRIFLTNYVVIRLVSTIETFCKNLTRKIIDEYHLEPKCIFEKDEIRISILDLEQVKRNKKITVGRIVSREVNFQNPKEIDRVLSALIGHTFFGTMKDMANKKIFSITQDKIEYFFEWNIFYELFDTRHKIVHEMLNVKIDHNTVIKFFTNSLLFLSYALSITTDKARELGRVTS